jgi:hypothetical protein
MSQVTVTTRPPMPSSAAWAAAKLVEVNLSMREDDPRLARAREIAAGATATAREALTTDQ